MTLPVLVVSGLALTAAAGWAALGLVSDGPPDPRAASMPDSTEREGERLQRPTPSLPYPAEDDGIYHYPPTSSVPDPTDRDSKLKEEDARRPTPTAVPPIRGCPAEEKVCEFGLGLVDVLGAGAVSLLALASPLPVECPGDGSVVALQPRCATGGTQTGFFTGVVAKSWGFHDAAGFVGFVTETVKPASHPRLVAIGCPYLNGGMSCSAFVAYTYSGDAGETLVVLTLKDGSGAPRVIGARRWVSDSPEFRGGTTPFGQPGLPYQGDFFFQPVSLP